MLPREVRAATDVGGGGGNLRVSKLLQRIVERLLHAIALAQLCCHVHGCKSIQVYQVFAMGAAAVQDALAADGARATATENLGCLGAMLACREVSK